MPFFLWWWWKKKLLRKLHSIRFFFPSHSSRHLSFGQKKIFHMFDYDYIRFLFCLCRAVYCSQSTLVFLVRRFVCLRAISHIFFRVFFFFFLLVRLVFIILAPVVGNFTEEEANGNTVPQDTLEYPLQRDEVHTQNTKGDRNHQIPSGRLLLLLLAQGMFHLAIVLYIDHLSWCEYCV